MSLLSVICAAVLFFVQLEVRCRDESAENDTGESRGCDREHE